MVFSMTAFARREAQSPAGTLTWELRSVNHRYLELGIRLPEELRRIEPQVRERAGKRLARGKVDVTLRWQAAEGAAEPRLDDAAVQQLLALAQAVARQAPEVKPLRTIDVLRWPGVVQTPQADVEAQQQAALSALDEALAELVDGRAREGGQLQAMIEQRLAGIDKIVAELRTIVPELVPQFRERLKEKLAGLREEVSTERLEQEIVLFAQRADVAEEIDRLGAHVAEVRRTLAQRDPIGRRLDFLMQELNREANTLGSKASDLRITAAAVDLKVLIEQIREQVQNIE